jgi:hypothetical protein
VLTEVTPFPLERTQQALDWLRGAKGCGAAVITVNGTGAGQ